MSYIKLVNISKNYQDGENVYLALKNINLEFNKNEFVAILGESGSGKSTLLNLISGISEITKGNIYINDESLKTFSNKRLNKFRKNEIGIIFQKYNLIDLYNVYNNIELISNNQNKIIRLLTSIGLKNKLRNKVSQLSGGETQRVSAIRALINDPSIILCDEPTGALDQENSEKLMDYLVSIKKDKLILFVTHNKELASKYASRIIELKDGKVINDIGNIYKDSSFTLSDESLNRISLKHKLIYIMNLIFKKKGRFLISLLSSVLVLFFISISLMTINFTNQYIEYSFLSSLNSNVIDLKSYVVIDKERKEIEISNSIINALKKDDRYIVRRNYDSYLNKNVLPNLELKLNNKKINLMNVKLMCMSKFAVFNLIEGNKINSPNEVIINENLYNYLIKEDNKLINKRFYYNEDYLKITGVSKSSMMNEDLVIYFNYDFIDTYLKDYSISHYQIDIKNLKDLDTIIDDLTNSMFYKTKEEIKDETLSFSIEYNQDYENYIMFYELINLAKIIVYFFLCLTIVINIMLLSNVLYSFNEEEKRNLAIFKILGFSYLDIAMLSIILGVIISLISFIIILFINHYIGTYLSVYISNLIGINIILKLSFLENLLLLIIILIISLFSSGFPLIKLKSMRLDNALKEE